MTISADRLRWYFKASGLMAHGEWLTRTLVVNPQLGFELITNNLVDAYRPADILWPIPVAMQAPA